MRPLVAIIALGAGNRRSMACAIERAGGDPDFAEDVAKIHSADALVIPGVANTGYLAGELDRRSLRKPILAAIAAGRPCLGICAGYQLLFEGSDEAPKSDGLGLFPGVVRRLAGPKSPHMGWNAVEPIGDGAPANWAYFAHSFAPPADVPDAAAWTRYGNEFASICVRDHVSGVQFHPERSARYGALLLEDFIERAKRSVG